MLFITCLITVLQLTRILSLDYGPTATTKWYILLNDAQRSLRDILQGYDQEQWSEISKLSLSENFIDEFSERLNWECLSYYQNLTEHMMIKYQNMIDWYWIYELGKPIPIELKKDLDHYFNHHHYEYLKGSYRASKKVL